MLSVSAMKGGQEQYYSSLAKEDYYLEGGEPEGVWFGKGAEKLGLAGKVNKQEFKNVFSGYSPDGQKALVQNAGQPKRQAGWDLTFSVPKSVSYIWSQVPEMREIIQEENLKAAKKALFYLEENAVTRRGHGGTEKEPTGLVIAAFEHGTSRAQDPQLHLHALALNLSVREDGTTGTIESKLFYTHKMAAGALYRAELAKGLEERLGFQIERKKSWFEIFGVPEPILDAFSKRRKEIIEKLIEKGFDSARASEVAALDTRTVKGHKARSQLFSDWQEEGEKLGFGKEQILSLLNRVELKQRDTIADIQEIVNSLSQSITFHNSHFAERDVIRFVAEESQGRGIGADLVQGITRGYLRSDDVIKLLPLKQENRYTTREHLALEEQMLQQVLNRTAYTAHNVSNLSLTTVLSSQAFSTIRPEQKDALLHITQRPGSVQVVSGMAGVGKTYLLSAAKAAWEMEGYEVKGIALAGKAAEGLQTGSGIESSTIASFLMEQAKGKRLTQRTVLVCDEAGMVSTRQLAKIVSLVEGAGAKLILVGDAKQLQSIEVGGAFKVLGEQLGEAKLNQITRQQEEWAKTAVHHFAEGNAEAGLKQYSERGLLHIATHKASAIKKLLSHWKEGGIEHPAEHVILAGNGRDVATLNLKAQELRLKSGHVTEAGFKIHGNFCHIGDRIVFTRNSLLFGVKNGTFATVINHEPLLQQIIVRLDNGKLKTVKLRNSTASWKEGYSTDDISLGYATTTHKAQGETVKFAYVLTDEAMQDRELSYVQVSRAKLQTRIYTTRHEAGEHEKELSRKMSRSRQKQMAFELMR